MPDTPDRVVFHEGSLTLPTYAITGENRNPVFRSQYGVAHIYPYTLQDEIDSQPKDKTYHTLILENRYLRVTVLSDLGGRVYSVYDKISEREVFYKNSTVKFSPLAIRGAFFSGGVEFSFPVAHAPTTADPINWDGRENPDGSASICFGGLEHISGLRWMITLTLFPGRCALAQDVYLYNPSHLPGRYHYWTNASLNADDQTEFIYPLQRARSYEFAGSASWPFARLDLIQADPGLPGMEGVPMWPANRLHLPVNFRWQKNMLAQVSIFGRNVEWDFFGAWQHSGNHGYAHIARARDVAGMKLWSWGNAEVGVVNQTALTDDGSLYAETQCGAMETQLDFDFLQPGKIRSWREWWLPLRDLGGLTCASVEVGAWIQLTPTDDGQQITAQLGLCPARSLEQVRVSLSIPGKILYQEQADLAPENVWRRSVAFNARELAGHPLTFAILDASGDPLLNYTLDRRPVEQAAPIPENVQPPHSAEDYFQLGMKHENFDNRQQAKEAYLKAIELAPEHAHANLRYGLMQMRSADFSAATQHLKRAATHGLDEAYYFLGVLSCYRGQENESNGYFNAIHPGSGYYANARMGLGCIALRQKEWDQAIRWFKEAQSRSPASIEATLMLAAALRHAGKVEEARQELENLLAITPLYHPVLRELALALGEVGRPYMKKLERLLADDRQYYLDLSCFYIRAGLLEDALQVLEAAWQEWQHAMLAYLAGSVHLMLGHEDESRRWFAQAAQAGLDYVFPSRLGEIQALEKAVELYPQDTHALYLQGNFYYAHERYTEATRSWEGALSGLPDYDVLLRNLGIAYWQQEQDALKAITFFEKALELNPRNYDLYLHLDDLYKAHGLGQQRAALLEKIQALNEPREDVRKRKVAILVDLGRYEEALQIMTGEKFVPLEMDQSFHDLYARAWLQSAEAHLKSNQIEEAISGYQRALEYPANLGVGRPTSMAQAEIFFKLGCAYEMLGLYRQALAAWLAAAGEHHPHGTALYEYVQKSMDKLSRYSELGLEP